MQPFEKQVCPSRMNGVTSEALPFFDGNKGERISFPLQRKLDGGPFFLYNAHKSDADSCVLKGPPYGGPHSFVLLDAWVDAPEGYARQSIQPCLKMSTGGPAGFRKCWRCSVDSRH